MSRPRDDLETCRWEQLPHVFSGGEETRRRVAGPRHRVPDVAAFTLQHVVDDEPAAGPEHSEGFRVERGLVGNVHRHMNGQCRVNGRIGKLGGRCVPDVEAGAVGQARPLRERRGHLAQL
jgi:hypothetical protein